MEIVCRWFAYSLGVVALNDREVMVSQRPELTLLKDLDGDGVADEYSAFSDGFGVSGNYHEFHFGPVRDKAGNFYVALGTASSGAGVRFEKHGRFDKRSYLQRMYACVPYRGWVCQVPRTGSSSLGQAVCAPRMVWGLIWMGTCSSATIRGIGLERASCTISKRTSSTVVRRASFTG